MSPTIKAALKVVRDEAEVREARTKSKVDVHTDALRAHAKAIKELQEAVAALQAALARHSAVHTPHEIVSNESA